MGGALPNCHKEALFDFFYKLLVKIMGALNAKECPKCEKCPECEGCPECPDIEAAFLPAFKAYTKTLGESMVLHELKDRMLRTLQLTLQELEDPKFERDDIALRLNDKIHIYEELTQKELINGGNERKIAERLKLDPIVISYCDKYGMDICESAETPGESVNADMRRKKMKLVGLRAF